jgi:hypothetical protein
MSPYRGFAARNLAGVAHGAAPAYFDPETLGNWPQAKKHTQWPGSGRIGDPVFDAPLRQLSFLQLLGLRRGLIA